jgi:hypothetical protein
VRSAPADGIALLSWAICPPQRELDIIQTGIGMQEARRCTQANPAVQQRFAARSRLS